MSKFDEIRNNVGTRSKSLLNVVADVMESVFKPTLALADDFAGFAAAQVRLPTQSDDFADYRGRSKKAYSKLGTTLKGHGQDLIEVVREVPGQVKGALTAAAPAKKAAKKATKKVTKKAVNKVAKK